MSGQLNQEIKNSRPFASLEVEAALNIQRTGDFLEKWTDSVLEPAGLRADQYNVLRILRGAGAEGHPSSEVRKRMVQDTDRLPGLVHTLRARGLIEGTLRLTITDAGRTLLASVDDTLDNAIRERLGRIDPAKLRMVVEVMERLRSDG
jgi:DNA-binding MarR family transcriptional regulator